MRAVTPPDSPARPLAWVLAATLAAAVLVPPETSGAALAGLAGLVLLAAVLAATSGALSARAGMLLAGAGLLALAARFASDPGPEIVPPELTLTLPWARAVTFRAKTTPRSHWTSRQATGPRNASATA
jgi:hypothetical protein